MAKTSIEYADQVSNPLYARPVGDESVKIGTFCEKPDKEGTCQNCWAEILNLRFGNKIAFDKANRDKIEWKFRAKELNRMAKLNASKPMSEKFAGLPLVVFCFDTFDIFQPSITDTMRDEIFYEYDKMTNLILLVQTTYPAKMSRYFKERYKDCLPSHYWIGMSAGTQEFLDKNARYLLGVKAAKKYVIFEPLLERVSLHFDGCQACDYTGYLETNTPAGVVQCRCCVAHLRDETYSKLDLVIIGGESNGGRQCSIDWIRDLVNQCRAANTSVFVKQYGTYLAKLLGFKKSKGNEMKEWSDDTKVRQMPYGS